MCPLLSEENIKREREIEDEELNSTRGDEESRRRKINCHISHF